MYSGAYAVNDAGVVAGYSYRSDTDIDAVVWRPSGQGSYGITDLGRLPGSLSSYTYAINDAGVIAGDSSSPGQQEAVHHAVTWTPTAAGSYAISELPVPPGDSDGTAFAINDAGVVAGDSFSSNGEEHALVWTGTRP